MAEDLREKLTRGLRTHGQASHDAQAGIFTCRCGNYTGPWLARHLADALLPVFEPHLAHLEAVEAAARRLVDVMDGYYPRPVQDALVDLARLTGQLAPTEDNRD